MIKIHSLLLSAALLAWASPAAAQAGQDPMREIQEMAERIEQELAEIDRMLLESSKPSAESTKKPTEALRESGERSELVEQSLDELIEKLTQMKNQGGDGYLRLLEFLPGNRRIQVKTYSPYRNRYKTDPQNQFVLEWKPEKADHEE